MDTLQDTAMPLLMLLYIMLLPLTNQPLSTNQPQFINQLRYTNLPQFISQHQYTNLPLLTTPQPINNQHMPMFHLNINTNTLLLMIILESTLEPTTFNNVNSNIAHQTNQDDDDNWDFETAAGSALKAIVLCLRCIPAPQGLEQVDQGPKDAQVQSRGCFWILGVLLFGSAVLGGNLPLVSLTSSLCRMVVVWVHNSRGRYEIKVPLLIVCNRKLYHILC